MKFDSEGAKKVPRFTSFTHSFFGKVDIDPAGKAVFQVPLTFSMAENNEFSHGLSLSQP
jgi:hypothetical protein